MKKTVKWIFIAIIAVVFIIDVWGLYKFKLKGTKYVIDEDVGTSVEEDSAAAQEQIADKTTVDSQDSEEYDTLKSTTLKNGQKLFISKFEQESSDGNKYVIKGKVYEQIELTKAEYNNVNNGKESIEIWNKKYKKDSFKSNKLYLKCTEENTDKNEYYIQYDATTKKYLVKDKETDYTVYKPVNKNVKLTVSKGLAFYTKVDGKSTKQTVGIIAKEKTEIKEPSDGVKIDLCTVTFDKNGECTKITQECR